jgi:hypothetical protein
MDSTSSYNPSGYTAEQLWALSLSAINTQANGERHDLLKHKDSEEYKKVLASWWDIRNAEQYRETLDWLRKEGGRQIFNRDWGHLATLSPDKIPLILDRTESHNPQQFHRFKIIYHYRDVLDGAGIAAWDIGRACLLARMAATANYIEDAEAWTTILEYGVLARGIFNNWLQFSHSYLIGRQYSMKNLDDSSGRKYMNAAQVLLTDPQSPWCRYPGFDRADESHTHH